MLKVRSLKHKQSVWDRNGSWDGGALSNLKILPVIDTDNFLCLRINNEEVLLGREYLMVTW